MMKYIYIAINFFIACYNTLDQLFGKVEKWLDKFVYPYIGGLSINWWDCSLSQRSLNVLKLVSSLSNKLLFNFLRVNEFVINKLTLKVTLKKGHGLQIKLHIDEAIISSEIANAEALSLADIAVINSAILGGRFRNNNTQQQQQQQQHAKSDESFVVKLPYLVRAIIYWGTPKFKITFGRIIFTSAIETSACNLEIINLCFEGGIASSPDELKSQLSFDNCSLSFRNENASKPQSECYCKIACIQKLALNFESNLLFAKNSLKWRVDKINIFSSKDSLSVALNFFELYNKIRKPSLGDYKLIFSSRQKLFSAGLQSDNYKSDDNVNSTSSGTSSGTSNNQISSSIPSSKIALFREFQFSLSIGLLNLLSSDRLIKRGAAESQICFPILILDDIKLNLNQHLLNNDINCHEKSCNLIIKDILSFQRKIDLNIDTLSVENIRKSVSSEYDSNNSEIFSCCDDKTQNWIQISYAVITSPKSENRTHTVACVVSTTKIGLQMDHLSSLIFHAGEISKLLKETSSHWRLYQTKSFPYFRDQRSFDTYKVERLEIGDIDVALKSAIVLPTSTDLFNIKNVKFDKNLFSNRDPVVNLRLALRGISITLINQLTNSFELENFSVFTEGAHSSSSSFSSTKINSFSRVPLVSVSRIRILNSYLDLSQNQHIYPNYLFYLQSYRPENNSHDIACRWKEFLSNCNIVTRSSEVSIQSVDVKLSGADIFKLAYQLGRLTRSFNNSKTHEGLFTPIAPIIPFESLGLPGSFDLNIGSCNVDISGDFLENTVLKFPYNNPRHCTSKFVNFNVSFGDDNNSSSNNSNNIGNFKKQTTLLKYRSKSIKNLVSMSSIDVNGAVVITSFTADEKVKTEIARISFLQRSKGDKDESNPVKDAPFFSSLKFPLCADYSHNMTSGVGIFGSYSVMSVDEVLLDLDIIRIQYLLIAISNYKSGKALGDVITTQQLNISEVFDYKDSYGNYSIDVKSLNPKPLQQPNKIFLLNANNLNLLLSNKLVDAFTITGSRVEYSKIEFGHSLNQTLVSVLDFQLVDLTLKKSVHRKLITNFDPNSSLKNTFKLHNTWRLGEQSVLEIMLENMVVVYLHRGIMTFWNFYIQLSTQINQCLEQGSVFRKINIEFVNEGSDASTLLKPNFITKASDLLDLSDGDFSFRDGNLKRNIKQPGVFKRPGMFRLGILLNQVEVHLPVNSFGSDSLVIITDDSYCYKSCAIIEEICRTSNTDYSNKTPYIAKKIWLSELDSINRLYETLFGEIDYEFDESYISWRLPRLYEDFLVAPRHLNLPSGTTGLRLNLALKETTIASWCSQHSVGEKINIDCVIQNRPSTSEIDGMYGSLFKSMGFETEPLHNKVSINVDINVADPINFVLSQGQYQCIVFMIQQNFAERHEVVTDWNYQSISPNVLLGENLYGKYAMDTRLPIFSSVPIKISRGRICAIEDTNDFYDLLQKPFFNSDLNPNKSSSSSSSAIPQTSQLLADTISSPSRVKIILGGISDTIPNYGYHHLHRKKLFSDNLSNAQFFVPEFGQGLINIHFETLYLEFFKPHYNGGTGIAVSADSLVIVDNTMANPVSKNGKLFYENPLGTAHKNIDMIPPEKIVFGSKYLKQLNRRLDDTPDLSNLDETAGQKRKPHIQYFQQGVMNLRRCVIDICESIAIVRIIPIMKAVGYFCEPTWLTNHRNNSKLLEYGFGKETHKDAWQPFDYKGGMDVEVICKDSIYAIPYTPVSKRKSMPSMLCICGDLTYNQAWRGFIWVGPGKVSMGVCLKISSVFVAPIHEISAYSESNISKTIFNPCRIEYSMELKVISNENNLPIKLKKLFPHNLLDAWALKPTKTGSPMGIRTTKIKLYCPDFKQVWSFNGNVDYEEIPNLIIKLSTKDISYFHKCFRQLGQSIGNKSSFSRKQNKDKFPVLWKNYGDLYHLPSNMETCVCVPLSEVLSTYDHNVDVDSKKIFVLLNNNTFNLELANVQLSDIHFIYNLTGDKLSMSSAVNLSAWVYNNSAELWEPLIEDLKVTAIAATDHTLADSVIISSSADVINLTLPVPASVPSNDSKTGCPKTRVEILSNPVEINASLMSISNLIKKISLGDVVTSTSVHLPPYVVINELGLPIFGTVRQGDIIILAESIQVGTSCPIDIFKFEAVNKETMRVNISEKKHFIDISFILFGEVYSTKKRISIDREGTFSVELKVQTESGEETSNMRSPKKLKQRQLYDRLDCEHFEQCKIPLHPYKVLNPTVIVSMKIKDDGGREVVVRSNMSLKNMTNKEIQIAVKLQYLYKEISLPPSSEWFIPIHLADPYASICAKYSGGEASAGTWFEIIPQISGLWEKGKWGNNSKLLADIVTLTSSQATATNVSNSANYDPLKNASSGWVLLVKPEVKNAITKRIFPVKYPDKDQFRAILNKNSSMNAFCEGEGDEDNSSALDSIRNSNSSSRTAGAAAIEPVTIQLCAPLQIFCIIPHPILYRIADLRGFVMSEGVLFPGQLVNIHNIYRLFTEKMYISFRLINYGWSKWLYILNRSNPFSSSERIINFTLTSLTLTKDESQRDDEDEEADGNIISRQNSQNSNSSSSKGGNWDRSRKNTKTPQFYSLPTLDLSLSIREHVMRLSCPVFIQNNTGISLQYCDSDFMDNYLEQPSASILSAYITPPILSANAISEIRRQSIENNGEAGHDGDDDVAHSPSDDEESGASKASKLSSKPNENVRRAASTKSALKLFIHIPVDHFNKIELYVYPDWTLKEVFQKIIPEITSNPIYQKESDYSFVVWDEWESASSLRMDFSPLDEQSLFKEKTAKNKKDKGDIGDENDAYPENYDEDANNYFSKAQDTSFYNSISQANQFPPNIQLGMAVSTSSLEKVLYMSSTVASLNSHRRLRLCHCSELHVYHQIFATEKEKEKENEGFTLSAMFKNSKELFHSPYMIWEQGPIPFNPHHLIGLKREMMIRTCSIGNCWSEKIEMDHLEIGNSIFLSIPSKPINQEDSSLSLYNKSPNFELSLHVQQGIGIFEKTKSISVVPKHIIVSKLSFTLDIKQIGAPDHMDSILSLLPGKIHVFNHPCKELPKLLEVRRKLNDQKSQNNQGNDLNFSDIMYLNTQWCGELNVSSLGDFFVNLRMPNVIVAVRVEMVGGSYVATFFEQNVNWPPIRIMNSTNLNIRFKQSAPVDRVFAATDQNIAVNTQSATLDQMTPKSSLSYAWDLPITAPRTIDLEFAQGSTWKLEVVDFEDIGKSRHVNLMKSLPSYGNPLAEGYLAREGPENVFSRVYCILYSYYLCIFRDESRNEILEIVNLSHASDLDGRSAARTTRVTRVIKNDDSTLSKFLARFSNSNNNIFGGLIYLTNKRFSVDINKARFCFLEIGEILGMFTHDAVSTLSNYSKATQKRSSDDEASSSENENEYEEDNELVGDDIDLDEECSDEDVSNPFSSTYKANNITPDESENEKERERGRENSGEKKVEVSKPNYNIKDLLTMGYSVDQLLDLLAGKDLPAQDFVKAMYLMKNDLEEVEIMLVFNLLVENKLLSLRKIENFGSFDSSDEDVENSRDSASEVSASPAATSLTKRKSIFDIFKTDKKDVPPPKSATKSSKFSMFGRQTQAKSSSNLSNNGGGGNTSAKDEYYLDSINALADFTIALNPPLICPELAESFSHVNRSSVAPDTSSASKVDFIFNLSSPDSNMNFNCETEMEYMGWLQSFRRCIEISWTHRLLKKPIENQNIDFYRIKLLMKIKSDGPTKVLEISNEADNAFASSDDIYPAQSQTTVKQAIIPTYKITDNLSVLITIESVALSFVDAEPIEFCYMKLRDNIISIERTKHNLLFAATVQNLQFSNQIMDPAFPVTLFPRRRNIDAKHEVPESDFPSVNLYFNRRFNFNPETSDDLEEIVYYEIFSLWIAPLQLDLEEELVARFLRYTMHMQDTIAQMKSEYSVKESILDDASSANDLHLKKSWGTLSPTIVSSQFLDLLNSTTKQYELFNVNAKPSQGVYFNLLKFNPVDIVINLRSSLEFSISFTESTLISVLGQLDGTRVCLGAFITEHWFTSNSMFFQIIKKHYTKQLKRHVISMFKNDEETEGPAVSVGIGLNDGFYDPLEAQDDILTSMSKSGKNIASGVIGTGALVFGGVAATVSNATGLSGKMMSHLTMDHEFQRKRNHRKQYKISNVAEGLFVGTQELGKNIFDGVTGIVTSPYQGWKQDGAVGLITGAGKGIVGVALKPAIGLLDLASRTTEGIKNTALTSSIHDFEKNRIGLERSRLPRSFGRENTLIPYVNQAAAAQYMIDLLTQFPREDRFMVNFYLHLTRKIMKFNVELRSSSNPFEEDTHSYESWNMKEHESFMLVLGQNRIALICILSGIRDNYVEASFVWSCPVSSIQEVSNDQNGDLVLSVSSEVTCAEKDEKHKWRSLNPVIIDERFIDYFMFQQFFEEELRDYFVAHNQPMTPRGGLIDADCLKRSSGILRSLSTPTKHVFQLVGCLLYEYTSSSKPKEKINSESSSSDKKAARLNQLPTNEHVSLLLNSEFGRQVGSSQSTSSSIGSTNTVDDLDQTIIPCPDGFLNNVYPVVNINVSEPKEEDQGRYSICIARKNGQKMRTLKRENETSSFESNLRPDLTLLFRTKERALLWKQYIERHDLRPHGVDEGRSSSNSIDSKSHGATQLSELLDKRDPYRNNTSQTRDSFSSNEKRESSGAGNYENSNQENILSRNVNKSLSSFLVIPTSGLSDMSLIEKLKIEIAIACNSSNDM